jgi:pyridoxine kinase
MARVLVLSSFVARGHVGLRAAMPALQHLGHEVVAIPTVLLSNHLGHRNCTGEVVAPELIAEMVEAVHANGWLKDVQAVLIGYLPTVGHVRLAASIAAQVSALNPRAELCCDPVIGDDPKGLYIDAAAAQSIREELMPLADMIFPNRFELSFLTGQDVEDVASAVEAARETRVKTVLATSIPGDGDRLVNLLVMSGDAVQCAVDRRDRAPHGTGDLISALFVGHRLRGGRGSTHLGAAVAGVEAAIAASEFSDELRLERTGPDWADPAPFAVEGL